MGNMYLRWSTEKTNEWYALQAWLVGCNFIPGSAINQLEMWQGGAFDPTPNYRELGRGGSIGFNNIRPNLNHLFL